MRNKKKRLPIKNEILYKEVYMKFCSLFLSVFFLLVSPAMAHPPSELALSYDSQAKILSVKMVHVTTDARHFIRKITVSINGGEPVNFYYPKQTTAQGMAEEIPLNANPGDSIAVKAICSKGGQAEGLVTVPVEIHHKSEP